MRVARFQQPADGIVILKEAKVRANASRTVETPVHEAADANLKSFTTAVRFAFNRGRAAISREELSSAKTLDKAEAVCAEAVYALEEGLKKVLPSTLLTCLIDGGEAGMSMLRMKLRVAEDFRGLAKPRGPVVVTASFDAKSENAANWAKKHSAKLIEGISETSKKAIRSALEKVFMGDITHPEYVDEVFSAVGDDARADRIARTESMTAANAGQREAWDQAVETGLLPKDVQKEWIATDKACPLCDELDGELSDLDGEYPKDGGDGPPLHPDCRCTEGISSES